VVTSMSVTVSWFETVSFGLPNASGWHPGMGVGSQVVTLAEAARDEAEASPVV
jgi:hypothetical protein